MKRSYETDLSDEQWEEIRDLVTATTGRKARVSRREVVNAILYVARTGCQWRNLPHDFPKWSTVYSCYHRWAWRGTLDRMHAALRAEVRSVHGKQVTPTAAIVDSQSVKVTSKGGSRASCSTVTTGPNA